MLFYRVQQQQAAPVRSHLLRLTFLMCHLAAVWMLSGCLEVPVPDVEDTVSVSQVLDQKGELHREVWKTVFEYYYDPEFNGVDWVKAGRETNDLLPEANDIEALYGVLKKMVNTLHDPHTYVLSPAECLEFEAPDELSVGLTTSRHGSMDDVDIVLHVGENSPAQRAGIEPGWLWLNSGEVRERSLKLGEKRLYRFLDHHEQIQEVELETSLLPKQSTQRESHLLEDEVLYLRFDYFEKGIAEWVAMRLAEHPNATALVLDLRWNPGGLKRELNAMFSSILPPNSNIGIVVTRKQQLTHEFTPPHYVQAATMIPIAVLVSPYSASCSEIMASVLQYHKRGVVVGTGVTAGEVLFSPGWRLPAGGLLKVSAKDYLTPAGHRLQGTGVEPDVLTEARTLFEFRRGIDSTLDAALLALKAVE